MQLITSPPAIRSTRRNGDGRSLVPAILFVLALVHGLSSAIGAQDSLQRSITTVRCHASRAEFLKYLSDFDAFFRGVGGTAAIALDGRILFSGAWGMADLEHRVPATPQSRFFIASVTKAFTGVALLKLAEEGGIVLDSPIQRYVTDFSLPGADAISVRLLAAHLSGVRHWTPAEREPGFLSAHYESPSVTIRLLAGDSLRAAPGSKYLYSSLGYNLLALAIERASNRRFVDYVVDLVLRPAGLQQTEFDDVRRIVPHRARGYSYWYPWFSRQSSDTLRRTPEFDYSVNLGGGNMLSTAEDLVRFGSTLLAPGFLTATSLRLLRTPIATGSSWSYGFTVASDSLAGTVLRSTGSDPGYQASLSIYPDSRLVIALLQNSWGIRAAPPPRFLDPVAQLREMCIGRTSR